MVKGYKPDGTGKWSNPALSSMRETAFGNETSVELHRTLTRAECMRDDAKLLKEAQEKRDAKKAKRAARAKS